jgi:hypothetical protein
VLVLERLNALWEPTTPAESGRSLLSLPLYFWKAPLFFICVFSGVMTLYLCYLLLKCLLVLILLTKGSCVALSTKDVLMTCQRPYLVLYTVEPVLTHTCENP